MELMLKRLKKKGINEFKIYGITQALSLMRC